MPIYSYDLREQFTVAQANQRLTASVNELEQNPYPSNVGRTKTTISMLDFYIFVSESGIVN